jgi:3-methyladenine DNA glycosylase Tag
MRSFADIYEMAASSKGGKAALEERLTDPKGPEEIGAAADDRWLAEATKCIFQAGFNWRVIENKWPAFEEAFEGFGLNRCAMLHDEEMERIARFPGIVANRAKLNSVPENARYFLTLAEEAGSLGAHFAAWSPADYLERLQELRRKGARLGGRTGQIFLRRMGVDSLVFSDDVVKALVREGVVAKMPSSAKDFTRLQEALDAWRAESGRGLNHISQVLAFSVG